MWRKGIILLKTCIHLTHSIIFAYILNLTLLKNTTHHIIYLFAVCILSFLLPFYRIAVVIAIGLIAVNWLLQGDFRYKYNCFIQHKYLWLLCFFYLAYLIGLSWSNNLDYGVFDITVKLALIIFPLIIGTSEKFSGAELRKIFFSFLGGNILAIIICLSLAFWHYQQSGFVSQQYFFYTGFSYFIHPSYFAMYCCLSLAICFWLLFSRTIPKQTSSKIIISVLIVFFICAIILLSSKAGIITMMLCIALFLAYIIFIRRKYLAGIVVVICFFLSIFLVIRNVSQLSERVKWMYNALTEKNIDYSSGESSEVRLLIWKTSCRIIAEHPLGVGTGDVKDVLIEQYHKAKMSGAEAKRLNAHNQFLQTGIALGFPGLLILLALFAIPAYQCLRQKNFLYLMFLIICGINFLVESMLETQTGVVFFAFFNTLLFVDLFSEITKNKSVLQ